MDGTQFERACGPILRKLVPELKDLIPSGLNAGGQVIRSLADGFCFINQSHYASVHITTNHSNLKKKWLYDGDASSTPKGDLVKSVKQAREMFRKHPDLRFTIFLVYNRPVEETLHQRVHATIIDDYISVKIIEQRQLVLFLDLDAEGQYLRQHLLGIDATRISGDLLQDIVSGNLLRYAKEIYFEETFLAKTSRQRQIEEELKKSKQTINLLTGESGFGKSTLCYSLMTSLISNGKIAFHIRPLIVDQANSLKAAIQLQLKSDHPGVFVHESDIDIFFKEALIIIDDINKSHKPVALLDKIISWNEQRLESSVIVICPVWPQHLNRLDNSVQKNVMFSRLSLKRLSFYDCREIIKLKLDSIGISLTDQQIHSLIIDTAFDPLLISFSIEILKDGEQYDESIPGTAIDAYISDQIKQIDCSHHFFEMKNTLSLMGRLMLRTRRLDPDFYEIEKWLVKGSKELEIVNLMARQRKLFLFDDEGKIFFRHDRVRDHLLTLSTIDLFDNIDENLSVLKDPYHAEIVGEALAFTEGKITSQLVSQCTLAVIYSLKFLQNTQSETKREATMRALSLWRKSVPVELVPKSLIANISYTLSAFDVKDVELLVEGFPERAEVDIIKFRNGNWLAAVFFFSNIGYYYPHAPTYWWDSILAHVKARFTERITDEFSRALPSMFTIQGITHAYTLAGFWRETSLVPALMVSWDKFKTPGNYPAYLWAILNCSTDESIVCETLFYWSTLSLKEKATKLLYATGPNLTLSQQIERTDWQFSEEILSVLLKAGSNANNKEIVALLLGEIDHPGAMSIVLDVEMQLDARHYQHSLIEERWDAKNRKQKLNAATLSFLLREFSNMENNERRRYLAWRFWSANVSDEQGLVTMEQLIREDDFLFEDAIYWRMKHHDFTALPFLNKFLPEKPWIIRLLEDVWNDEAKLLFKSWLEGQLERNNLEGLSWGLELLKKLDNVDAYQLLQDHWEKLKFAKNALETALYLATPETRKLADAEIKRLGFVENMPMHEFYVRNLDGSYFSSGDGLSEEKKNDLLFLANQLRYLHLHYNVKYEGEEEKLTDKKMESLLPYLSLFSENDIYHFAIMCLKIGATDMCYQRFYPLLKGHLRKRIRFTTKDLIENIEYLYQDAVRNKNVRVEQWFNDPRKYGISPQMIHETLMGFSKKYYDSDAFFIVTFILEHVGTRNDIDIIDNFFVDFKNQSKGINYMRENTIFTIKRRSLN